MYPRGIGLIGGVLYSRVARTCSCFRGPEGRLVYVGRELAYVIWSGIPSLVLISLNRRCSSVLETHFSVHHRSLNNWNLRMVCEGVGYEVS